MFRAIYKKKGVALFLTLAVVMIAVILIGIILGIMLNHLRLTQHQVGRIQAYYASFAGMNLALENLRTGVWQYVAGITNSCPDNSPCPVAITDFPPTITAIQVRFCPSGDSCIGAASSCSPPAGSNFCLNSTAAYVTND